MKVICIHHRLTGYSSHHYNESHGFIEEFRRRGREFVLLANRQAPPQIVKALNAQPVFDDPTFRLEWSFEERSNRFLRMLHEQVDRRVRGGDCVMLTIATQLEAHALTRWLAELPRRKKPWIVVLFLSDRWNRSGSAEYARQIAEFAKLKATIASLSADDAKRIMFFGVTELLSQELAGLLGTHVGEMPMPQAYSDPPPRTRAFDPSRPRVAILGGTRGEKGSYLIPDIIRACRTRVPVEFLVHLTNNSLTAAEAEQLATIAGEPHVEVINEAMTPAQYYAALDSSDLALFPYEVIPYRKRTSGVFAESIVLGKPVVATGGTWLAEQIAAGRAAGTIFDDLTPDSIADAIARCVEDLATYQQRARSLAADWRRTVSIPAFVELMEAELARRVSTLPAPAKRWWFW